MSYSYYGFGGIIWLVLFDLFGLNRTFLFELKLAKVPKIRYN